MEPYSNEAKRQAYSADHDGSIPSGSLRGDTTLKLCAKGDTLKTVYQAETPPHKTERRLIKWQKKHQKNSTCNSINSSSHVTD